MSYYSPSIEKLIESFEKLPSIGHKTAQRLAFYMLDLSNEEAEEFIRTAPFPDDSYAVTDEGTFSSMEMPDTLAKNKTNEKSIPQITLRQSFSIQRIQVYQMK